MKWGTKSYSKILQIKVFTYDNDLDFQLSSRTTGQTLFDMVCASLGLQETECFGLENYYVDSNGQMERTKWLKLEKRISAQKLNHSPLKQLKFLLHPKFYPEDIERELIQPITRHLFYLDVKNYLVKQVVNNSGNFVAQNPYSPNKDNNGTSTNGDKLSEEGHLDLDDGSSSYRSNPPSDVAILLASISAQAEYGDLSETEVQDDEERMFLPGRLLRLLPSSLLMQCQLSQEVTRRIKQCYKSHKGMSRDDAELAYLKVASLYRLFGISYFMMTDKMNCANWLGISATGICIYSLENKHQAINSFSWQVIKNVSYKERKFTIKLTTNELNCFSYPQSQPGTPRITTPGGIDPSLMSSTSLSTHLSIPGLPSNILKDQLSVPNSPANTNLSMDTTKATSLATGTQNCSLTTSPGLPTIKMDSCKPGVGQPKIDVWLQTPQQAKVLMRLCKGNSELFMKRRLPETSQTLQMRIQARAERSRREVEQARLNRARAEKQAALEAKAVLEEKVAELEAALESCKSASQLMAEKARYAQQEAKLHEEQVQELTRCLDRGIRQPEGMPYWGNSDHDKSLINLKHPRNSLPSLRCQATETKLTLPCTDPLARKKHSPCALVKQTLFADPLSVQQLFIELSKEKGRFEIINAEFLTEMVEACSHLEIAQGTKLPNGNKLHPLFNYPWLAGLDACDEKNELGPNFREVVGHPMIEQLPLFYREMMTNTGTVNMTPGNSRVVVENHYSVPVTNVQSLVPSVPHSWTSNTPMMRKRIIGPLPQYYEMGGYIVNTTTR